MPNKKLRHRDNSRRRRPPGSVAWAKIQRRRNSEQKLAVSERDSCAPKTLRSAQDHRQWTKKFGDFNSGWQLPAEKFRYRHPERERRWKILERAMNTSSKTGQKAPALEFWTPNPEQKASASSFRASLVVFWQTLIAENQWASKLQP